MQNAHPLNYTIFGRKPELGQLNVTIGKYYRITGESTQDRGVTPDIALPSLDRRQRSRREHPRPRAALGSHRTGQLQGRRRFEADRLRRWRNCTRSAPRTAPTSATCTTTSPRSMRCAARRRCRLNLKTREAERKRQETERLERENAWRAAHDVKPVEVAGGNQGRCGRGNLAG